MAIFRTVQSFLPGGMKYEFVPLNGLPFQPLIVLLGLLPILFLLGQPNRKEQFKPLWLPIGVALATLTVVVIRSYLSAPVYLAGRSDMVVLPMFLLALSIAAARSGPRAKVAFLSSWIILSAFELVGSAERLRKPGNLEMSNALDSAGCTTVVATGLSFAPMTVYELGKEEGALVVPFPIDMASHPGNLNPAGYTAEELGRDAHILAREYPAGPGLCVLGGGTTFGGPLAEAYLGTGAEAQEEGVYHTSVLDGQNYVLVTFSGT